MLSQRNGDGTKMLGLGEGVGMEPVGLAELPSVRMLFSYMISPDLSVRKQRTRFLLVLLWLGALLLFHTLCQIVAVLQFWLGLFLVVSVSERCTSTFPDKSYRSWYVKRNVYFFYQLRCVVFFINYHCCSMLPLCIK